MARSPPEPPLHLLRSHIVPPGPTFTSSTISFLPDFSGSSWIAYSASSLLVISHFPSPISDSQTLIGPCFRQVIDLTVDSDKLGINGGDAAAVSWCTETPSNGEVAAAVGEFVFLLSPNPDDVSGSFCWRQTAGLAHCFTIEVIGWTGSGDGLIVAGIEVVLWKRSNTSWEIAWKSKVNLPQSLVSATYYVDGLIATAAGLSINHVDVSIYHNSGQSFHLRHPQPVAKIQWRPSSKDNLFRTFRDVLMTCCIDGTVRLWSEIDNGSAKKDNQERCSFHVIAVVEINQCMVGMLGKDIFIEWAVELGCPISTVEGDGYSLSSSNSKHDIVGECEWLISIGPKHTVTFWAIHCLDDTNPLRFPRVTLWRKQNLMDFESDNLCNSNVTNVKEQPILVKAVISRNLSSGPPVECSLIQLLPDNSLSWSQLYSTKQNGSDEISTLCCYGSGVLNIDGHTGSIIQLDIHPYCEIELAVSLDSNGFLLFWSLPTISNNTLGMQKLGHSSWILLDKINLHSLSNDVKYSSIKWSPSVLDENLFLLMGYADGIDCFQIKLSGKDNRVLCDKISTVPFTGYTHMDGPPDQISVIPIALSSEQSFFSNTFLLFALWTNNLKFQALSWKIILHSADASISSEGKLFYATVALGSSLFPEPQNIDLVTSVSVSTHDNSMMSTRQLIQSYTLPSNNYHMATGYSDGTLKLWNMFHAEAKISEHEFAPWELVGTLTAHEGTVNLVSSSSCSSKIATVSINDKKNISSLHIWEPIRLINGGSFLLEDEISLNGSVIALNWLSLGNGHLLLAVCLPSELRIYSEKNSDPIVENSLNCKDTHIWCCIAISYTCPASHGFLWGPKLTPVVIHKKHISLYSRWLFKAKEDGPDGNTLFPIYPEGADYTFNKSLENGNKASSFDVGSFFSKTFYSQHDLDSDTRSGFQNLLVIADKLLETSEIYHPVALLQHLYSGNWKRAYVVLKHLVKAIKFGEASATSSDRTVSEKSCYNIPEIDLANYFEETIHEESSNKGLQWGQEFSFQTSSLLSQNHSFVDDISHKFSSATNQKSEITHFIDTIEKSNDMHAFRNIERFQLLAIIDLLLELRESGGSSVYNNLDKSGRRFWVAVRFQQFYSFRKIGKLVSEELVIKSRDFAWAFQSDCQDNLLNSLSSANPSWFNLRNLGVGFWFSNTSQLRIMMEKLARSQYLIKKDPKDCALLYMALNRIQVLAGLFKVSRNEKDKLLVGFLLRNFKEEKNKAAALKNAYVLMGRHQLELAIAFFLLGGDPSSAVTVCAKNLGDEQLALVICRLIEGHGGQLERQLISSILLPNAIDKKDFWLASLLEWELGNYSASVNKLFDSDHESKTHSFALYNLSCFLDPDIGQYCVVLATKNNMKNFLGDYPTMILLKLATIMSAKAFKRCGFPLEALECFSSSFSKVSNKQASLLDVENHMIFYRIFKPFATGGCNWQQVNIADTTELNTKLNMAMEYITKSLKDNPIWLLNDFKSSEKSVLHDNDAHLDEKLVSECIHKLELAIKTLERKYLLKSADLANEILVFANNKGLFFLGFRLLHDTNIQDTDNIIDGSSMFPRTLLRLLLKASQEISCLFSQYVACCSLTDSVCGNENLCQFNHRVVCLRSVIFTLRSIRPLVKFCGFNESLNLIILSALDLLECFVHFASCWFGRNVKGLIAMIRTILNEPIDHQPSFEFRVIELMKLLHSSEWTNHNILSDGPELIKQSQTSMLSVPDYEIWQVIGASLWIHLSKFSNNQLREFLEKAIVDDGNIIFDATKLLLTSTAYVSSMFARQLASFLRQKVSKGLPVTSIDLLDASSHNFYKEKACSLEVNGNEEIVSQLKTLWEISFCANEIYENFKNERIVCFSHKSQNICASWKDIHKTTLSDDANDLSPNVNAQGDIGYSTSTNGGGSLISNKLVMDGLMETNRRNPSSENDIVSFHNPVEILKRSGELLEAICFNSIYEQQVAAATNRKGLVFFNYNGGQKSIKQDEYLWSESDWPQNGWAGCESKPVPTYVSQDIDLGSKSGAHLGLGRATIGLGSLAKPRRDLTGGGAFGIPGYAGIGASGLGWGEQEDFDEFTDPIVTVTNVSTQTLSRHPCRPFFLVGSINTHIYLWEFGKDSATSTYGILPAAKVPTPYAHASISSLQFDHCGHRFASAALDGTISSWQLEVGGRGNVYPTESSLCFTNHADDVAYVAASGSIIAAAGCSANGVNVVVWDTLAPPLTSQASILCHEGGARSLSVFDKDIGSGSISPLIVTGGKNGDVGMHDFRYIATGKTKRNKNSSQQDCGMLWYIPRAHLGSITKVSTIPNTSLFLTGSKDGDVKLWDAKKSQLVFHWQKMHDRHTFLQPNSRSIGGVVRAAVTDIQVLSRGFLTCGGDGCVKLVQLK